MNLFIFICFLMQVMSLQAQFVGIHDDASQNRFLGVGFKGCKSSGNGAFQCGNDSATNLLNLDLFSSLNYGKQFYIFNDYVYWVGQQSQSELYDQTALRYTASQAEDKVAQDFPAPGIYMIVIGTSQYLKEIIAPEKVCPAGQWPVMAQLKYNDGDLIYAWSQDSICLARHESFSLQISSDVDNTVEKSVAGVNVKSSDKNSPTDKSTTDKSVIEQSAPDAKGIDWMKNLGPTDVYQAAKGSPRKIRLIK